MSLPTLHFSILNRDFLCNMFVLLHDLFLKFTFYFIYVLFVSGRTTCHGFSRIAASHHNLISHTAKILYRKFIYSQKEQPQSQCLRSGSCVRFIYSHDRSAYSAAEKYVDRSWAYINRPQTNERGKWD